MAKRSLTTMSIDALLKLRDEIGSVLSTKADSLRKDLAALGHDFREVGRIAVYGRKK